MSSTPNLTAVNASTLPAGSMVSSAYSSIDPSQSQTSLRLGSDAQQLISESSNASTSSLMSDPNVDVDSSIIEALKGKDRIYVLKLGEQMESLIQDRRPKLETQPTTSYQRLLVHRCSGYYKLTPESDPVTKAIIVHLTPESKIPTRRIFELVPAETTTQPAFQIMRRVTDKSRPKPRSHAGSVAGEDADLSDNDPISETGSLGGRSATDSSKKRMTIEEREAAYNEARNRIWMGFDETRREKDKDMSASSSSLSLASGSTNGGGRSSSVGEGDDGSSPATESEWSGPSMSRDKKEGRRSLNPVLAAPSRSMRPAAQLFYANGSTSSRNSRAASPAVKYASLYEPQAHPPYDATYPQSQHPNSGYPAPYPYPYPPPNQPMHHPPYMGPYGYYAHPYPQYQPPQPPPQATIDPSMSPEMYQQQPHSHPAPYSGPYWPHPHPSAPGHQQPVQPIPPHPHPAPPHGQTHPVNPPPPPNAMPQYPPFIPPSHAFGYPMGYYSLTGQPMHPPPQHPHPHGHPPSLYDPNAQHPASAPPRTNSNMGSGVLHPNANRNPAIRNTSVPSNVGMNMNKPKNPSVGSAQTRAWSYGPGVGGAGLSVAPIPPSSGETVGPRLINTRRSNGGVGNRTSPNDDVASTTSSSTTSSVSRKPPSTPSSQHPLPARPDWAVGLKPQPSLHSNNGARIPPSCGSGTRPANGMMPNRLSGPQQVPISLQGTDFPPLIGSSGNTLGPERRSSVVPAGAWNNPPPLRATASSANGGPNVQAHRMEESDPMFDRPPKSTEFYNKHNRRSPSGVMPSSSIGEWDREGRQLPPGRSDPVGHLAGQMGMMMVSDEHGANPGPMPTVGVSNASSSSSMKSTPTTPVVGAVARDASAFA